MIKEVKAKGAEVVVLGEMFNCPFNKEYFKKFAEDFSAIKNPKKIENFEQLEKSPTPSIDFLQFVSESLQIFLIGGSIPVKRNSKIFNTTLIYDNGKFIDYYDKTHTFDINIPGVF